MLSPDVAMPPYVPSLIKSYETVSSGFWSVAKLTFISGFLAPSQKVSIIRHLIHQMADCI